MSSKKLNEQKNINSKNLSIFKLDIQKLSSTVWVLNKYIQQLQAEKVKNDEKIKELQ